VEFKDLDKKFKKDWKEVMFLILVKNKKLRFSKKKDLSEKYNDFCQLKQAYLFRNSCIILNK